MEKGTKEQFVQSQLCIKLAYSEYLYNSKNIFASLSCVPHQIGCQNQNSDFTAWSTRERDDTSLQLVAAPFTVAWLAFQFCLFWLLADSLTNIISSMTTNSPTPLLMSVSDSKDSEYGNETLGSRVIDMDLVGRTCFLPGQSPSLTPQWVKLEWAEADDHDQQHLPGTTVAHVYACPFAYLGSQVIKLRSAKLNTGITTA